MKPLLQWKYNSVVFLMVHVTVNNAILLNVAQKYFYGEFISLVTIECT
jgi:hypothetical protein